MLDTVKGQCEQIIGGAMPDKGLFAFGTPGTGKSHCLYCMAKAALHAEFWKRSPATIIITDLGAVLRNVKAAWSRDNCGTDPIGELVGRDYLFLDELTVDVNVVSGNVDSPYRWAREAVEDLIYRWWQKGTPGLYITSNNTPLELAEAFNPQTLDRLRGICDGIEIIGESHR